MSNEDRDLLTRSEYKKRVNRTVSRKKMDRLLNVLIAIVSVLIIINLYFVFSNKDDHESADGANSSNTNTETMDDSNENEDIGIPEKDYDVTGHENESNVESDKEGISNGQNTDNQFDTSLYENEESNLNDSTNIIETSNDPIVEVVYTNPNWQATPTRQTGPHISSYEKGNIDYEEKLETIRNAVNLEQGNIIYWSVRNNGSSETSISVVSSKDQNEKYRVSIEWVANQGWKPVKVEKLLQLDGAY